MTAMLIAGTMAYIYIYIYMLGKQIQERRELQTNKCNFNSQKSQRNGGGRYLISSASILNTLQYIYIYIYIQRREVAN